MASPDDQQSKLGDLLTVSEAASTIGVCASTLRNWDRQGKLKASRHPINGYRLYRREDLARLIEQLDGPTQEKGGKK